MSDLVERLTKYPSEDMEDAIPLLSEAADRIEELECEKARLANYMHRVEDAVKAFALEAIDAIPTVSESDPDS